MGTFGRLVFCEVRTQIVGETKFRDSLKQEQPGFRPAAPAIKGRIESRKQEHVGGSYAFHIFYDTE